MREQFTSVQLRGFTPFQGYTSDSRAALENKIFVALKGQSSDGHDFVNSELIQKAGLVVVSHNWLKTQSELKSEKIHAVYDTTQAHREIAKFFRHQFKGKIIGIGGSSGKTTTKEFLFTLLSQKFKCFKTLKSQNGELGIPKTLEQLSNDCEIGIVEIGIDAPGEMIRHCDIVNPDFAVLTSIGEEHLNLLKNVDNVFSEEKILFDQTLQKKGFCFAPNEDKYLIRYDNTPQVIFSASKNATRFGFDHLDSQILKQNACLAAEVCLKLGLTEKEIQKGATLLKAPDGRGVFTKLGHHKLIEDHYNSNPSSLKIALENAKVIHTSDPKSKLVLVLGDMLDLGESSESMHKEMIPLVKNLKADCIFLVGPQFSDHKRELESSQTQVFSANSSVEMVPKLKTYFQNSQAPLTILFKGSRGMKLEICIDAIKS